MKTFQELSREFNAIRSKWAKVGAGDTEPRVVAALVIGNLLEGEDYKIPTTIRGWQLFEEVPGADEAAKELTACLRKMVTAAKRNPKAAQGWAGY